MRYMPRCHGKHVTAALSSRPLLRSVREVCSGQRTNCLPNMQRALQQCFQDIFVLVQLRSKSFLEIQTICNDNCVMTCVLDILLSICVRILVMTYIKGQLSVLLLQVNIV